MATISPSLDTTIPGVPLIIWSGVSSADTITAYKVPGQVGMAAAVSFTSAAWGGATVALHGSVDGVTYFQLEDVLGNAISTLAANALFEFSTSCTYLKVVSSGGAADDVDVKIVFRGPST